MKRTLLFLMALMMAGMTTYLFFNYTQDLKPKVATVSGQTVSVVVAKEAIKKDTQITGDMVVVEQVPKTSLQPDAVKSVSEVTDKVALVGIQPGEMVLSHHLMGLDEFQYLAYKVKPGFRAVTVTAEVLAENVANLVEPGDFVDVIFSTKDKTTYLLKNVHVLAVDQRMRKSSSGEPYKPYTMTTLELSPEDALTIVDSEYKVEQGPPNTKLTLVLRSAIQSSKGE